MLPTPKLDGILKSRSSPEDQSQHGGCSTAGTGGQHSSNSTERLERVLAVAFDRIWRDRPPSSIVEDPAQLECGDPQVQGTIDGYISRYFRKVAELSRESVYQAHQRQLLHRMREDIIRGDRCGNMRELDERIRRVELDDSTLRAEIANLMNIVDSNRPGRRMLPPCCGTGEGGWVLPAWCCGGAATICSSTLCSSSSA